MKIQSTGRLLAGILIVAFFLGLNGCARVPMASLQQDAAMKKFPNPQEGKAGLYIYRDSTFGYAVMDNISIDDQVTGKVAVNTFLYRDLVAGSHTISIPTEFASYKIDMDAKSGENYFLHYYVRMGVFKGNGAFELVDGSVAKDAIVKLKLAQ